MNENDFSIVQTMKKAHNHHIEKYLKKISFQNELAYEMN